jgi:hypothetical protein
MDELLLAKEAYLKNHHILVVRLSLEQHLLHLQRVRLT